MNSISACLAHNIKQLRRERGLTQEGFSEVSDLSIGTIKTVESGSAWLGLDTVSKFSKAFGVSESRLFQDPDAVPTPTNQEIVEAVAARFGFEIEVKRPKAVPAPAPPIPDDILKGLSKMPNFDAVRAVIAGYAECEEDNQESDEENSA